MRNENPAPCVSMVTVVPHNAF